MNKQEFVNVLFDEDDTIGVCPNEKAFAKEVSRDAFVNTGGNFFVINAIKGGRKAVNVTSFRNFLVEFDGMELEKQRPYVDSIGMPFSTQVYSGGKSYHFIISLEESLSSETEYKHFANYIQNVVKTSDTSTKSCVKLSRLPDAYRAEKGKFQELVEVKTRVKNSDLFAWLDKYPESVPQVDTGTHVTSSPDGRGSIVETLDWYVLEYLKAGYTSGLRTFVRCPLCADDGYDKHEDNMCIDHSNKYFHCFKNSGHNKYQLARMIALRREHSNPVEDEWKRHNEQKKKALELPKSIPETKTHDDKYYDEMDAFIKEMELDKKE